MDDKEVIMYEVTEEKLRARIKEIEDYFPEIASIKASDYCCNSHAIDDVKEKHGAKLAALWQNMNTAKWFLGE